MKVSLLCFQSTWIGPTPWYFTVIVKSSVTSTTTLLVTQRCVSEQYATSSSKGGAAGNTQREKYINNLDILFVNIVLGEPY